VALEKNTSKNKNQRSIRSELCNDRTYIAVDWLAGSGRHRPGEPMLVHRNVPETLVKITIATQQHNQWRVTNVT